MNLGIYTDNHKKHLIQEQRYAIAVMYKQGSTQKKITEVIGKDKSVISRELKRNANPKTGKYTFDCAKDLAAWRKKRMKNPRRLHL